MRYFAVFNTEGDVVPVAAEWQKIVDCWLRFGRINERNLNYTTHNFSAYHTSHSAEITEAEYNALVKEGESDEPDSQNPDDPTEHFGLYPPTAR